MSPTLSPRATAEWAACVVGVAVACVAAFVALETLLWLGAIVLHQLWEQVVHPPYYAPWTIPLIMTAVLLFAIVVVASLCVILAVVSAGWRPGDRR